MEYRSLEALQGSILNTVYTVLICPNDGLLCIDWVAYNVSFAWFINGNATVILLMCLRMQSSRGAGSSNVASCPAAWYREI